MPSLEEEFIEFTDRANLIDHRTSLDQRRSLRRELDILDQARLKVPAGTRRTTLDTFSRIAFRILERRIYAVDHPTVLDAPRPGDPPSRDRRRER
ncbi:hypothetical protein ACWDOP_00430 [Nocardia sp. NPDC003693]